MFWLQNSRPRTKAIKILVADKDASVRELVAMRLSARDYEVLEAHESEEALRLLDRDRVDLILFSTEMERVGGRHVIELVRQKAHFAMVPIILMTEEQNIAELVMSQDRGFDDFLIKPFNPLVLQLRVSLNIVRSRQRVEANALTRLPGNPSIERIIRQRIESGEKFSVIYLDINHFKSFNDRYGFEKGDDVIRQTAGILVRTVQELIPEGEPFVGHIGGDDFVVVTHPQYEEAFARKFIGEFDRLIPTYYNERDQKKRSIRTKDRQGKQASFPLMSCSVAACNNLYRTYRSVGEVAQDAAEVKSFLKSQPGSHYLRDRRNAPIFEINEAMRLLGPEIHKEERREPPVDPLGQVLLNAGLVTQEELSQALKQHLETGQRLGQVLISMNLVKSEDVGKMLEKKLNVPYFGLRQFTPEKNIFQLFTMEFIKAHRVVPLSTFNGSIQLGMCDPFDLATLDSIERITGLKPVPCLTLEDEFETFLDRFESEVEYKI